MPKIHVDVKPYNGYSESCSPCIRCGRRLMSNQRHHITYNPEQLVNICVKCHGLITTINAVFAGVIGSRLSNDIRQKIWNVFLTIRNKDWPLIK